MPQMGSEDYEVKNQRKEKQPGHFYITIEERVCRQCGHNYKAADNGVVEYYLEQ